MVTRRVATGTALSRGSSAPGASPRMCFRPLPRSWLVAGLLVFTGACSIFTNLSELTRGTASASGTGGTTSTSGTGGTTSTSGPGSTTSASGTGGAKPSGG